MTDYEVGYKKPPLHTRFKKGVCPNPKGRGARGGQQWTPDAVKRVLYGLVRYKTGGVPQQTSRAELLVKNTIAEALKGNVAAARQLLTLRKHSIENDCRELVIRVSGGLPQKTDSH